MKACTREHSDGHELENLAAVLSMPPIGTLGSPTRETFVTLVVWDCGCWDPLHSTQTLSSLFKWVTRMAPLTRALPPTSFDQLVNGLSTTLKESGLFTLPLWKDNPNSRRIEGTPALVRRNSDGLSKLLLGHSRSRTTPITETISNDTELVEKLDL